MPAPTPPDRSSAPTVWTYTWVIALLLVALPVWLTVLGVYWLLRALGVISAVAFAPAWVPLVSAVHVPREYANHGRWS